jgi:hypothetical protein
VSLSSGDEVPHIFTRKSCLRPKGFLIASAKDFCNKICQKPTHAMQQTASFAVGMRVTSHPPHRSVRAAFPHTVPTLGIHGNYVLPYASQHL